jgi:hypothetical protein
MSNKVKYCEKSFSENQFVALRHLLDLLLEGQGLFVGRVVQEDDDSALAHVVLLHVHQVIPNGVQRGEKNIYKVLGN